LANAEDAQDALQEAFLNAYQSLDSFKGDSQFFTWLYRIAVNAAISLKRKQRVALRLEHEHAEGPVAAEPADTSTSSQPGLALERADQERRMQHVLSLLSPEHRAVLVMKEIDGLKYEDIAAVLQVPVGTVRSRLFRARMELRELLDQGEGTGP
jgi:RNA polymerase sigma-70 factor (ECF subfamily)